MIGSGEMKEYLRIEKPVLGYQYEFDLNHLGPMSECVESHGFAIIKDVLCDSLVELLKQSVFAACGFKHAADMKHGLKSGESKGHLAWIESNSGAWELLKHEPFIRVQRYLTGSNQLTINRSAAIIRMPGFKGTSWHSDWCGFSNKTPQIASDVLNRGPWLSGTWFYLTGSRPEHGGLCVIEDSHHKGWNGPKGFKLAEDKKTLSGLANGLDNYCGYDVPGMVPLFTNPVDLIVFAHRTYHAPFPNQIDEIRLSCGIGFRERSYEIEAPWEMPESGKQLLQNLPECLQGYTHGYTSIEADWRAEEDSK